MSDVRVRFAPSPTGFLHVGGARTALFNWMWAKKSGGKFILRIEDTDQERSTQASVDQILESFKWLGIDWDEGPFYQSERLDLYRKELERLRQLGKIYPAFDSKEELDEMRNLAMKENRNPIYDRRALKLTPEEVQAKMDAGEPFVWRFKVPDGGHTMVPETNMGEDDCQFENDKIGDFIITRPGTMENPGWPLYNFCVVVDDHDMGITNIIRGVEHLSNTPKQVLIYEALGYPVPKFTHLPLINKKGKKMSKRDADADPRFPVSVSGRRDLGYLKEATLNFLCLVGWSHPSGEELFAIESAIENFSLDRFGKSSGEFDEDKYLFQNGWYIRNLPTEIIVERVKPLLAAAGLSADGKDDAWLAEVIGLEIERSKLLTDFVDSLAYFFKAPETFDPKGVKKLFKEGASQILRDVADILEKLDPMTAESMEEALRVYGEGREMGFGKVAQPCRLAVTGRTASPGLFEVFQYVGKEESARRLRHAAELIDSGALTSA